MFASIVTAVVVCVALAISGWDPPDTSIYVEDSTQLMLSYEHPSFAWPYEISMDDIAEWFLFFDDQKLMLDHQFSDNHQCDCYGTAVHNIDPVVTGRRYLPDLHITFYQAPTLQSIRTLQFDLQRLPYVMDGFESEGFLTSWENEAVLLKPGSLIRVNPGERNQWQTISLDGRLLLLSALLQVAVWVYKHNFDKKMREQIKDCRLTEERINTFGRAMKKTLTRCTAVIDKIDRLDRKPKKIGCVNPCSKQMTIEADDMFSWSSREGFSSNFSWYKISSTKNDTSDLFSNDNFRLYEIPEWRYLTKEC